MRYVPEDRGGSSDVARLIRTEKEVEGRYTEQWVVVEEDAAIDQEIRGFPEANTTEADKSWPRSACDVWF